MATVLQDWVTELPFMQQTVLISAVRGPDGMRKEHPIKVLLRWYRRCVLISAFDKKALTDPYHPGGGDFTGPYTEEVARKIGTWIHAMNNPGEPVVWDREGSFGKVKSVYFDHVDELPYHFHHHFMAAIQIIGFHHPDLNVQLWWRRMHNIYCNKIHVTPETKESMMERLSDDKDKWKKGEGDGR